jgi:surfeit locus 1 family protein
MLQKLRTAGLIWPSLATLAAAALLLSLGQWQWSRKAWKEELIAAQTARAKAEPVPLVELLAAANLKPEQLNYRRVVLSGTFDHSRERHVYTPLSRGPGWQVMTPVQTTAATLPFAISVFVDRGFVPDDRKDPATRADGQPLGEVTITGRIRVPGPKGQFTPDNEAAANRWFWRDIANMWQPAAMQASAVKRQTDFYVEAAASASRPGANTPEWPKPGMSDAIFNNLSNRHLEYALTWWALAATLLGVYAAFTWQRIRGV